MAVPPKIAYPAASARRFHGNVCGVPQSGWRPPMISEHAAEFVGSVPEHYDRGIGPVMFLDFAADMAGRVAALRPQRVLETASGTGIVTRLLRDKLPAGSQLMATDLNPPMLEVARAKF